MARIARVVIPNIPHYIMHQSINDSLFVQPNDYETYLNLLASYCLRHGVDVWAYCLLPKQVQLIVVPFEERVLGISIGETQREYAVITNKKRNRKGRIWSGRYLSCPLDDYYVITAARFIERLPLMSKISERFEEYPWSSAKAHLGGHAHNLANPRPLLSLVQDWRKALGESPDHRELQALKRHARTGRPLGNELFIRKLEKLTQRNLRPQRRGPKPEG